jgi:hypothetical protein
MNRFAITTLLTLATTALACTAPAEQDDGASSEEAAISEGNSCSPQQRAAGQAQYKSGVDRAKAYLRDEACDDATLHDILNDLGKAVSTCSDFRNVIATSPWAVPARKALDGNLSLAALTGKLKVKDAGGKYAWTGLSESLVGVTMFGPALGVYGNNSKITFRANGAGIISRLEIGDEGAATWTDSPMSYRINSPNGAAVGITITEGAKVTSYSLVEAPLDERPLFELKGPGERDTFTSLPEECSA